MPDHIPKASADVASLWWQQTGWYRALTLAERHAARSIDPSAQAELATWKLEQAERKLQDWKAQSPFQAGSFFADRLAADGVTEPELLVLLAESPEALQARLALPEWLEALRQALEGEAPAVDLPDVSAGERSPVAAFLPALQPLLAWGRHRLLSGIDALAQHYPSLPFEPPPIVALLLASLTKQMLAQVSRTFALELKVVGGLWRLAGTTPEERFEGFVLRLCQREVFLPLLEEYAVLARQLVIAINQCVVTSLDFFDRLCADWQALRTTFSPDQDPGLLLEVRSDAGDRHREGRSVLLLRFASGLRLVYKPKSLAIDLHFQELLRWLDARGAEPEFQTLTVLDRGAYGWSAFVAEQGCDSEEAVQRFYERQGAYLALLYVLEATDLHHENLIAAGEHPMLVDLETLLHPRALLEGVLAAGEPAFATLEHSVARVGLLPFRIWGNEEAAGVNISGLGGEDGQQTPRAVPQWEGIGTDQLRLVRARREIQVSQNRPRLHGQSMDAYSYQDSIQAGFKRMYRLLIEHREALLVDVLPRFAQDDIRFIARPTDLYARFLYDSFRPELLRDALERERHFDRLWVGIQWQPALARLIPAERVDLLRGDVPFFIAHPASCDLFTSQGECIPAFFQEPSLEGVRRRLRQLDEQDLARQVGIIHASFACLVRDTPHRVNVVPPSRVRAARVTRTHLLAAASAVGDALEGSAVRGAGTVGWLGIAQVREREWTLQPAGLDLYSGLPGITMFLAYLAALTGEQRHLRLAEAALHNIRAVLAHPYKQEAMKSIGAFDGWGGLIYVFSHVGRLWNQPVLFQEAEEVARLLPNLIEQDEHLDIMAGAAGCISALLSLYAVAPSPDILALAIRCGDRLLASAQPMQAGMGWKVPFEATPLTGFAHGASGIALSLLRLSAVSGDERFRPAASAAMAYERGLFSPVKQNWPDLRTSGGDVKDTQAGEEERQRFMVAWCYGAPGVGLARLASLPLVDDATIRQEIEAALQTTLALGLEGEPFLCHGTAGNLETLLVASQMLDGALYQEAREQGVGMLLHAVHDLTRHTEGAPGTEPPGLMLGLAGIGYALLRAAAPERVPSILTLDSPVPSAALLPHARRAERLESRGYS